LVLFSKRGERFLKMRTKYSILALALLILFGCTTKEEKVNLPSIEEKAIVPGSDSRLQRAFRLNSHLVQRGNPKFLVSILEFNWENWIWILRRPNF